MNLIAMACVTYRALDLGLSDLILCSHLGHLRLGGFLLCGYLGYLGLGDLNSLFHLSLGDFPSISVKVTGLDEVGAVDLMWAWRCLLVFVCIDVRNVRVE